MSMKVKISSFNKNGENVVPLLSPYIQWTYKCTEITDHDMRRPNPFLLLSHWLWQLAVIESRRLILILTDQILTNEEFFLCVCGSHQSIETMDANSERPANGSRIKSVDPTSINGFSCLILADFGRYSSAN
jgi:hypothetical protein